MVSRNLERANENDGFKMTALENLIGADMLLGIVGTIRFAIEQTCVLQRTQAIGSEA